MAKNTNITIENKLSKFENFLSYFTPQCIGQYKGNDIYLSSTRDYVELFYKDIVLYDNSGSGNHIMVYESCGVKIPKTYTKPYFNMLDTIGFSHLIDKAPEANIGPSTINKMFHQIYYSITG